MEVASDPIHTLEGEDSWPSRKHAPDSQKSIFQAPDPDPDDAFLLEHPSYVPPKTSSNGVTFINLLKSNIGAGFLAMPYAFANFGILGGCLVMPLIVGVAVVGMRLLVSVKARLRDAEYRTKPDNELTYPAIAKSLLGGGGKWVVLISLIVSQLGTCCAYLIFWGNTFEDVFPGFPRWAAIVLAAVLVLPLCMMTNPRGLRWSSFVGLALGVLALLSIYGYNISLASKSPTTEVPQDWRRLSTNVEKFPRFFGISTFAMEGITVVLPLEQGARHKATFPALMTAAMVVCGLVFGSFGALGYAVFGSQTHQSVLKNLPSDSPYVSVLEVVLALNLLCTLPVQLFPISEIVDHWLLAVGTRLWWQLLQVRFMLLLIVTTGAVIIQDFGDTLSIVGGFSFMIIGVIVPVVLHMAQTRHEMSTASMVLLIIVVGQAISLCVMVTGMSLYNLFEHA